MTKTVALSDDAYDSLARLKRPGQSFSELVQELVRSRRPRIREVAGTLSDDSKHWERFAVERQAARRQTQARARLEE